MLLLRILAPQVAALLVWYVVRLLARDRDPIVGQLSAVVVAAIAAVFFATTHSSMTLTGPRLGAFIALEVFVALLAQLLIITADDAQD